MSRAGSNIAVLGVTGHQDLSPSIARYVLKHIERIIRSYDIVDGISSLAAGADQIFASCLISNNKKLKVIVPADDYRDTFSDVKSAENYDRLLSMASDVVVLPFKKSSEDAFFAAGELVVIECTHLLAVWDGRPARGRGGTADIVQIAKDVGKAVTVIWPQGIKRP